MRTSVKGGRAIHDSPVWFCVSYASLRLRWQEVQIYHTSGAGLHVMDFDQFLNWLEGTPIAVAIREHEVLFPWIESFHVLAIALVVGTISIVDLPLIGLAS